MIRLGLGAPGSRRASIRALRRSRGPLPSKRADARLQRRRESPNAVGISSSFDLPDFLDATGRSEYYREVTIGQAEKSPVIIAQREA
jgi:hypothetical protein